MTYRIAGHEPPVLRAVNVELSVPELLILGHGFFGTRLTSSSMAVRGGGYSAIIEGSSVPSRTVTKYSAVLRTA